MFTTITVCLSVCAVMILAILFKPTVKIGKFQIDTYWPIALLGAILLLVTKEISLSSAGNALIANTAINPVKILVLFISMTVLSIFLDELGFFAYLASVTLKRAKSSQKRLFLYLYLTVSVLTVFTSNDVIILSFTPFICYFAKNAKISPIPYLASEFVAANTWSMALVIGNPTNIYLATAYGINFVSYLKTMILPTLLSGTVAFFALYLTFFKQLGEPISQSGEDVKLTDKINLIIGLIHLGVCTVFLAIGSYLNIEMWLVAAVSVLSLFVCVIVSSIFRKERPAPLFKSLKRAPWQLIPFVLSMFIMIITLENKGVTAEIATLLGEKFTVFKYGLSSFLTANVINNIPMSVLFCSIIESVSVENAIGAVFATVIGSNLGAFFTPIGALAGIMWSKILNDHGYKFGYLDFLKIGVTIALPTLVTALIVLQLII